MKNGMIRIGMFEAYLERMLVRGLKVAYISYFTRTLQEAKAIASPPVSQRKRRQVKKRIREGKSSRRIKQYGDFLKENRRNRQNVNRQRDRHVRSGLWRPT